MLSGRGGRVADAGGNIFLLVVVRVLGRCRGRALCVGVAKQDVEASGDVPSPYILHPDAHRGRTYLTDGHPRHITSVSRR